jgi:hypothetical protein
MSRAAGVEHPAEVRVHSGAVLVPQRITQWMKCGELPCHQRQRETQDLRATFLVLQIAHFVHSVISARSLPPIAAYAATLVGRYFAIIVERAATAV